MFLNDDLLVSFVEAILNNILKNLLNQITCCSIQYHNPSAPLNLCRDSDPIETDFLKFIYGHPLHQNQLQIIFSTIKIMQYDFNFLKCGVVGGLAGLCVDTIEYPVETMKTRIMASSIKENLLKNTQKLSKFRGLSCQLLISFPYSFTFFVIYQGIRDRLPSNHFTNFFAAVVSETVSNVLRNPFELVKQQIMVGRSDKILPSLRDVYHTLGLKGFYMGYSPALIRDILFSAIEMPLYQHCKPFIAKYLEHNENSPTVSAIAGGAGAVISSILTTPLDVIKTRHMTMNLQQAFTHQISSSTIAKIVYKQQGVNGFFKGVWHRCGLLTTGAIIYFYAYAYLKNAMGVRN